MGIGKQGRGISDGGAAHGRESHMYAQKRLTYIRRNIRKRARGSQSKGRGEENRRKRKGGRGEKASFLPSTKFSSL